MPFWTPLAFVKKLHYNLNVLQCIQDFYGLVRWRATDEEELLCHVLDSGFVEAQTFVAALDSSRLFLSDYAVPSPAVPAVILKVLS